MYKTLELFSDLAIAPDSVEAVRNPDVIGILDKDLTKDQLTRLHRFTDEEHLAAMHLVEDIMSQVDVSRPVDLDETYTYYRCDVDSLYKGNWTINDADRLYESFKKDHGVIKETDGIKDEICSPLFIWYVERHWDDFVALGRPRYQSPVGERIGGQKLKRLGCLYDATYFLSGKMEEFNDHVYLSEIETTLNKALAQFEEYFDELDINKDGFVNSFYSKKSFDEGRK